jgi:predicted Holliday junction resolvase-like endonuclease
MIVLCLAVALLAMQIYVKRSIQGKVREAADEIGEQYSAELTTSSLTQTVTTKDKSGQDQYITSTGTPRFITVQHDDGTTEKREIMEIKRTEPMTMSIGAGSYEQTGKLSDEKLFPED